MSLLVSVSIAAELGPITATSTEKVSVLPSAASSTIRVPSTIARPMAHAPTALSDKPLTPTGSRVVNLVVSNPAALTDSVTCPVGKSARLARPSSPVVTWAAAASPTTAAPTAVTTAPAMGSPVTSVTRSTFAGVGAAGAAPPRFPWGTVGVTSTPLLQAARTASTVASTRALAARLVGGT